MAYKVVCNKKNCWTRTYIDLETAERAINNHTKRFGHAPVYIFKMEEEQEFTSTQLLAMNESELSENDIEVIDAL